MKWLEFLRICWAGLLTLALHGAIIAFLVVNFQNQVRIVAGTKQPLPATLVVEEIPNPGNVAQAYDTQLREQKRVAEERRVAEQKRVAAAKRAAAEKRRREIAAQKLAAEQKRLAEIEAEKKRQEDEARRIAAEKKRKEEEAKRLAAEKKRKEEEARRLAAEKKRQQEEEARRLAEQKKREAETRLKNEATDALSALVGRIKEVVTDNWRRPDNQQSSLTVIIQVQVKPDGEVVAGSVFVAKSSGNPLFDHSAANAVYRASPLPFPTDPKYYEYIKEFAFKFTAGG